MGVVLLCSWLIFILIHFSLSSLWRRSYILSTLILVFWTSRSLHLNNSSIWDHFHNNFWNRTKNNLWEPINDLCHELYFSSWKCCLGTSYVVGLETDTRAYFTGVTILISLPTGTKIFNWLSTYLGNPPLLHLKTSSALFALLFLLMFTIGGSTGVILGNAAVDLALHDTYYVVAHFHFVLSLGAVIAIFSGIIFNGEKILGKNLLASP